MAFSETLTVEPSAPLDFVLTCQIFGNGDPAVRAYVNGEFNQVLNLNGELALVKVASKGTIEQPKLLIELVSNKPITPKNKKNC